jgi:long-chain acyl-CoA synthetase
MIYFLDDLDLSNSLHFFVCVLHLYLFAFLLWMMMYIFFNLVVYILGYGQTEGAAAATISYPQDQTTVGHVGGPTPTVEIALYDVPDMGYYHTDRYHSTGRSSNDNNSDSDGSISSSEGSNNKKKNDMIPCYGRGEICIRGPNVFKGYYKDVEKTQEMIDPDGWLHSGDIGLWKLDGTLQIIDRKKNLLKLSHGEYVAPEKIENIISRSQYIAQCYVHGDSLQNYLVAIIVPDEMVAQTWWDNKQTNRDSSNNIISETNDSTNTNDPYTLRKVCHDKEFYQIILTDIHHLSKINHLNKLEIIQNIYLSSEPFTVENNLLTPTFKLKRQQVHEYYKDMIQQLYNNNNNNNTKTNHHRDTTKSYQKNKNDREQSSSSTRTSKL